MGFRIHERSTFRLLLATRTHAHTICLRLRSIHLHSSVFYAFLHSLIPRVCACMPCILHFAQYCLPPLIGRFLSSFVICVQCILCMFSTSFATLLALLLNEMQSASSCYSLKYCAQIRNSQAKFGFIIDKWVVQIRFQFWFPFINLTTTFIYSPIGAMKKHSFPCITVKVDITLFLSTSIDKSL